jgi:hypothetical protein
MSMDGAIINDANHNLAPGNGEETIFCQELCTPGSSSVQAQCLNYELQQFSKIHVTETASQS